VPALTAEGGGEKKEGPSSVPVLRHKAGVKKSRLPEKREKRPSL